jgi:hypothetical protein
LTKPLYFYNGTTFELVGPTTPQSPIAYQTSAPTAPATGDLWIDSDGDVDTYNRQLTRYYFVATAAQTTITGIDANGLTLAYVAGSEAVYVNGALQVRGQDYTATNGTSVVLSSGLAVNDVVEIFAYTAFTVANAYTKSETDGVAAAAAGLRLVVPTSVAVGSGSGSANAAGQVTFSGASSVSLNDVFSTTYDNYRIVLELTASANIAIDMRMRFNNADNSSANYWNNRTLGQATNVASVGATTADTSFLRVAEFESGIATGSYDLFSPFKTQITSIQGLNQFRYTSFYQHSEMKTGQMTVTTSYTGFSLIPTSGNITGTVSVYGYKD